MSWFSPIRDYANVTPLTVIRVHRDTVSKDGDSGLWNYSALTQVYVDSSEPNPPAIDEFIGPDGRVKAALRRNHNGGVGRIGITSKKTERLRSNLSLITTKFHVSEVDLPGYVPTPLPTPAVVSVNRKLFA